MRGDDGPARVADGVPEERIGDVREVDDHPEPMHLVDDRPSDVGEPLAVTVVPRGAADRAEAHVRTRVGGGEGQQAGSRGGQGVAVEGAELLQGEDGLGPNSFGVMCPSSGLNATFARAMANTGDVAFLSQSGQLYGEAAAMAVGKAYVFGPTFRAEKSKTRRHLTEFWMVEPEVAWLDLEGNMDLAEDFLVEIVARVIDRHEKDLTSILERDLTALRRVKKPFPRITYTDAVEAIRKAGHPVEWGADFGGDEETVLAKQFDRPVMVHRYPASLKAFYFKKDPRDPKVALGVDVLAPEGYGEIIGGGQREDDYETLLRAIDEHELPREAFSWYLDLRKFGSVPHSGFGLGVERTLAWICGLHHVRETIPFPRMMERLTP